MAMVQLTIYVRNAGNSRLQALHLPNGQVAKISDARSGEAEEV